jgi:hypothetical protein
MRGPLSSNTGDASVELDALPVDVLRTQIVAEVEKRVDLDALAEAVCVIVLISEPTEAGEQAAWSRLTAEQFFAGYSEADAIYDGIWAMRNYRVAQPVV